MDVMGLISWVFSSAFANMVVVGLMGASLVLASLPSGPVTSAFDTVIGYCFFGISLIGALCIPLGLVMLVARIDWGPKCLIMGGIMTILGSVISNGGIFAVVLNVLGLHVPVVT
jgi:hypothetical protein